MSPLLRKCQVTLDPACQLRADFKLSQTVFLADVTQGCRSVEHVQRMTLEAANFALSSAPNFCVELPF